MQQLGAPTPAQRAKQVDLRRDDAPVHVRQRRLRLREGALRIKQCLDLTTRRPPRLRSSTIAFVNTLLCA